MRAAFCGQRLCGGEPSRSRPGQSRPGQEEISPEARSTKSQIKARVRRGRVNRGRGKRRSAPRPDRPKARSRRACVEAGSIEAGSRSRRAARGERVNRGRVQESSPRRAVSLWWRVEPIETGSIEAGSRRAAHESSILWQRLVAASQCLVCGGRASSRAASHGRLVSTPGCAAVRASARRPRPAATTRPTLCHAVSTHNQKCCGRGWGVGVCLVSVSAPMPRAVFISPGRRRGREVPRLRRCRRKFEPQIALWGAGTRGASHGCTPHGNTPRRK